MSGPDDVEFDLDYYVNGAWNSDPEEIDWNPRCGIALRVGDTWIPGGGVYLDGSEVSFWLELFRALESLHSSSTCEVLKFSDGELLVFERSDNQVRITNYYEEAALEDASQRLGIEKTCIALLSSLTSAALDRVNTIVEYSSTTSPPPQERTRLQLLSELAHRVEELCRDP